MATIKLRPTLWSYIAGSNGNVENPTKAFDLEDSTPVSHATQLRSSFGPLQDPGIFWLHGFPPVPPGTAITKTLVIKSSGLDPDANHPYFCGSYNLEGETPASPAVWINWDHCLHQTAGSFALRTDTAVIPVGTEQDDIEVAFHIEGTLYSAHACWLLIYDCYVEVEYAPAASLGYVIGRQASVASCLQPLAAAFFFNAVESDGILKFVPLGGSSALTIPESDLGLQEDGCKVALQLTQEQELPREAQVNYIDAEIDYEQNTQTARRHSLATGARSQTVIDCPCVLDKDTAAAIAEKSLYLSHLERKPFEINLWKFAYAVLDPTDVVQFVYGGNTYQVRLVKNTIGAGYTVAISCVSESANTYTSSAQGGINTGVAVGSQQAVSTLLWLFDIPLLRDADLNPTGSGFYYALARGGVNWPGAALYGSADDSAFALVASSAISAHYGEALNVLGAPTSPWAWDDVNTLTIFMEAGTLAGSTEAAILAGPVNALLVGDEVLQFRDVTENADGSYTISHLLRGRRGTEAACATHAASEVVIDLSAGGLLHRAATLAEIGVTRYYRAVTLGQEISSAASEELALAGNDLKPLSPVAIGGSMDENYNMVITWLRRSRAGGTYGTGDQALTDCIGGPLNEESEAYEVDILDDEGAVVRTITGLTVPTAIYTVAQQIEDFGPSTPESFDVVVYQISAAAGRGWPGYGTVPAATAAPEVESEDGMQFIVTED